MLSKLVFFVFLISSFQVFGSQIPQEISFGMLEKEIKLNKENNSKVFKLANDYLRKAKAEDNMEALFKGYDFAGSFTEGENQIKYCDSMLIIAQKLRDNKKIAQSQLALSECYMATEKFQEALDHSLIAYNYFKESGSKYDINLTRFNIATIKSYLYEYQEARNLFFDSLEFFRNNPKKYHNQDYSYYYLYSLIGLIDVNTKLKRFSENKKLIDEGKNYTLKSVSYKNYYPYFISSEGTDFYFQNDYKNAILKLENALGSYKDKWKHLTEKYYLGMSHWNLGDHEKAMTYFKLIDEDYNATGKLFPEFRPTYEKIIEYHKERGDKEQQLVYTEKLLKIDRDLNKSISEVSSKMQKQFDTPNLIAEKEKEHRQNLFKYGFGLLTALLASFGIYRYIKRKKLLPSVEVQDKLEIVEEASIDYELYRPINKETVKHILAKLEVFEDEKQFTEKGIKLSVLANSFGTNERYLSQIIKTRTGKSFNEYLSDLRLNLFKTLSENQPNFTSQNLSKIASQLGFTNHEMFIKEFKSKYNVTPRVYLDGLKL